MELFETYFKSRFKCNTSRHHFKMQTFETSEQGNLYCNTQDIQAGFHYVQEGSQE